MHSALDRARLEERLVGALLTLIASEVGRSRLERTADLQVAFFAEACVRIYANRDRSKTYGDYLSLAKRRTKETSHMADVTHAAAIPSQRGFVILISVITTANVAAALRVAEQLEQLAHQPTAAAVCVRSYQSDQLPSYARASPSPTSTIRSTMRSRK